MPRIGSIAARAAVIATGASLVLALPAAAHEGHGSTQEVAIKFTATAGDEPVACGTPIPGIGSTGQTARLQDLRFYVTGVALVRRGGRAVPVKLRPDSRFRVTRKAGAVTLIDLEDATGACAQDGTSATNAYVRGTVPHGSYVGVRWTVGVPAGLNHTDVPAAPAPLNLAAMAWSWQAGRKFMKIELADPAGASGTWAAKAFMVHLGSTGCAGNPATGQTAGCTTVNQADVRLKRFDPEQQQIALDLKALIGDQDVTVNHAGAPGCMSGPTDPECGWVFRDLGIGWRSDGSGNGASPANRQSVFRAIAR